MDDRLIDFSRLSEDDLQRLAVLHRAVMRTLLSELGLPLVLRYYRVARADPGVVGLYARSASGDALGWAVGSPYPDRINAQLRSPLTWFAGQMLWLTVTRPLVTWQLVQSALSASGQPPLERGALELTYIGVAADQRGQGLGKRLLDAFLDASRSRGYRSVVLSVETENLPAVSLYERAGFKVIRTFLEGRYQRYRMEVALV